MAKDSRKASTDEAARRDEATTLESLIRQRARGLIDAIVEEELEAALGAASVPTRVSLATRHALAELLGKRDNDALRPADVG